MCEFALKTIGMGFVLEKGSYLRDGWNIFDFIVFCSRFFYYFFFILNTHKKISLLNFFPNSVMNFTALRALRILRTLRSINQIKG